MRFTKMSLVAALLIGSSAFAIENTKVSGDANVYYHTQDKASSMLATSDGGFFEAANSAADIGLNFNATTDLYKDEMVSISAGAGATVLTTLGLENNLVGNVWGGAHGVTAGTGASYASAVNGAKVEDSAWVNEAWVAATSAKTTVKVGRMALDTPLAFTETWTIEKNTFEAAVLINQDIPDTTIVAAFIGNGNGSETFGQDSRGFAAQNGLAIAPVVNVNGEFATYGSDGAYAIAAINNSWKPLTAQAWYYDVTRIASAYWLQGDLDFATVGVEGLTAGLQYTAIDIASTKNSLGMGLGDTTAVDVSSDAFALMVGYSMKDLFSAKLSFSQVGDDHSAAFNTATAAGTAQSKLYTEAWWSYGQVTAAGAQTVNLTVEAPVKDIADLGLYITSVDQDTAKSGNGDFLEATLTASKSFGPLDATAAYIFTDVDGGDSVNALQAYLTFNF